MDEFSIIRQHFLTQATKRDDVVVGIGDDGAVLAPASGKRLVCTTDMLLDGVHFPETTDSCAIGYKALAVNLSDLAAMGAEPAWATLLLSLPVADPAWIEGFSVGFFELAEAHDVQLIGGDLARGPMAIGVQAMGYVSPGYECLRSGAQTGDDVYVSGWLGDASLGLKAVQGVYSFSDAERKDIIRRLEYPSPRVALGQAIANIAHAVIDISDGLYADVGHISTCSGVGTVIRAELVPLSETYQNHFDEVGWQPAFCGGDDYELCFVVPPESENEISGIAERLHVPVHKIGHIVSGDGVKVFHGSDELMLDAVGYNHFS